MEKQSKALVSMAEQMFWERIDHMVDKIVSACEEDESVRKRLTMHVKHIATEIYDTLCAHIGTKEFMLWAVNRPFPLT